MQFSPHFTSRPRLSQKPIAHPRLSRLLLGPIIRQMTGNFVFLAMVTSYLWISSHSSPIFPIAQASIFSFFSPLLIVILLAPFWFQLIAFSHDDESSNVVMWLYFPHYQSRCEVITQIQQDRHLKHCIFATFM